VQTSNLLVDENAYCSLVGDSLLMLNLIRVSLVPESPLSRPVSPPAWSAGFCLHGASLVSWS
jgi:hypothetical protein